MRKKLILAENANLFAEVERRQIEVNTLKIKLAEKEQTTLKLENEVAELTEKTMALEQELLHKEREIEALKKIKIKEEAFEEKENSKPLEEKPPKPKVDSGREKPTLSDEEKAALRELAALSISRLTKAVARLSLVDAGTDEKNTEELYSLALGKNESFKIKVSKLLDEGEGFEEIKTKIERLTEKSEEEIKELIK